MFHPDDKITVDKDLSMQVVLKVMKKLKLKEDPDGNKVSMVKESERHVK